MLNLGHNKLKHLARDVLALPGLAVLDASHNRIKDFLTSKQQQQPGAGAAAASSSTVAVLNLSFNKLKELPEDLGGWLQLGWTGAAGCCWADRADRAVWHGG